MDKNEHDRLNDALEKLTPLAQEMTMDLLQVVNGSTLHVRIGHPKFAGKSLHTKFWVKTKPAHRKKSNLRNYVLDVLWRAEFHAPLPYALHRSDQVGRQVLESDAFKTVEAKFMAILATVPESEFRKAIERNKKDENARILSEGKEELRRTATKLMKRGASFDEVQDLINQVLVEWTHNI